MTCRLKSILSIAVTLFVSFPHGLFAADEKKSDPATTERQFRELPAEARRNLGPLFWLHGDESQALLEKNIQIVAEGGNGCFTAESRPHNDWLGPNWYRDLKICLDAAKQHNLQMWIFDEAWWPSQMVGGKVPPQYGTKYLEAEKLVIDGPKLLKVDGYGGPQFIAALAGRINGDGKVESASLLDLADRIHDGKLQWDAPAGKWRVMKFTWRHAGAVGHQKAWISVDGASRDCVEWFINYVYQPHYDHFKDDFGKTIAGYFYDEPETQGDWGTEVIPELKNRGVDWKIALVARKFELANPEEQLAAQYQYRDAFAEAWGRTLYGGMSAWCRAHGVKSMGHFMEHGALYLDPSYCAGNMFQLQKYSDMGAIDLVCNQMHPGERPHDIYQTPKLASSISHAYGKQDDLAMCEIFGGYNQVLSYPEMKWLTDQHQVRGVNFLIPHSFNPRAPYDRDYPPYFYNGGFEPRWPLYRVYADYASRLSLMLTGGHHVCPVAQLYLGNSFHAGKSIRPEDMTTALQDALYDCDWMPYDVLENDAKIDGATLRLHQEQYRVLIVPAAEVIPYATLAKAKAFFDAGGVVIGYGILPTKSATLGKNGDDIAALRNAVWGTSPQADVKPCRTNKSGGKSYFLPESPTPEQLQQVLAGSAAIHPTLEVVRGETDHWLHALHRVKDGRDVFLVANQKHDGLTKQFRFRIHSAGYPEVWDAIRGEINSVAVQRIDDKTVEFDMTLEPLESALLVLHPQQRKLPPRITPSTKCVHGPIAVERVATPPELICPSAPPGSEAILAEQQKKSKSAKPLTVSPVKSDPFVGRFTLPVEWLADNARIYVEMKEIPTEPAAALRVNGQPAGGCIGKPYRVNITAQAKAGENRVEILPFAPKEVRVVAYPNQCP